MSGSDRGHVQVTRDESVVYCQVVGLGNMNNCAAFQEYTRHMREQGFRRFVVDLSSCRGLDSTFLGSLVGLALNGAEPGEREVLVVNANDVVLKTLREVGIDQLLTIVTRDVEFPEIPLRKLEPMNESATDRARRILAAHERLCEVDDSNVARFRSFIGLLQKELGGEARE